SIMDVTKQIKLKQLQKDQPDAEFDEDFEKSQYGSSADSDGRKPKYQLIKEKDDEIMGRGQDEILLKIDVDITSDEYKESVKRKKERDTFLRQVFEQKVYSQQRLLHSIPVPPIIARAAGIPGTQDIVPIPPLWSKKVDPQREKDIQIELLDNEKKVIPGNIPATEYPASLINVTPSTHHFQFVIPTHFRPPAPALFVVNSCNYTAATLTVFGLQRYIEKVPGVVLNIDREKRELILADGSLDPYDMLIIAIGLQDQILKRLSQPFAKNDFHVDVADGAITMNDEADAIRFQSIIHKPTQPGGKK
ncbi:MAG: hypothetical protein EZS28_027021, partial [Streblomastix strix]